MTYEYESYLAHHGVKGQKWGNRRYQNEDGSLTEEGRRRYGYLTERAANATDKYIKADQKNRNASIIGQMFDIHGLGRASRRAGRALRKRDKFESKIDRNKYVDNKYGKDRVDEYVKNANKVNKQYDKFVDKYISKHRGTSVEEAKYLIAAQQVKHMLKKLMVF